MITNNEILKPLKAGKIEGMEKLFDNFFRPLVLFANNFIGDISLSEDLVQEELIIFWRKKIYKKLINDKTLVSYLYKMIKNKCLNELNKKKLNTCDINSLNYEIAEELSYDTNEKIIRLTLEALESLSPQRQNVIKEVMLKGNSYQQAAENLGISKNTVKTLLRNGINVLREKLGDKEDLFLYLFIILRK